MNGGANPVLLKLPLPGRRNGPSFRPWEPGLYKSTKRHPAGYYIELAERYQAELDSGLFPSLRALARSEGISAARVSQLLALLRIEPDFRAELKAGEGDGWSMRRLMELAALPPEEQRATCDGRDLPHGSSGEE
jgi:hypothetical protein